MRKIEENTIQELFVTVRPKDLINKGEIRGLENLKNLVC